MFERFAIRFATVTATGTGQVVGVQIVTLPVGVGARLAEGRDGYHDQAWESLCEARVVEPPFTHPGRCIVLDQQISVCQQFEQQFASRFTSDIERYGTLAGIQHKKAAAFFRVCFVRRERSPVTGEITGNRRFHLDHGGSVVRQQAATEGGGYSFTEFQYAYSVEGGDAHGLILVSERWTRGVGGRKTTSYRHDCCESGFRWQEYCHRPMNMEYCQVP